MIIRKVPIEKLREWEDNPRIVKEKDYKRLKEMILKLGFYKPLIVSKNEDGTYTVLGGNARLRALRELGYKEVEVSIVKAESFEDKLKYNLSDNDTVGFYDDSIFNYDTLLENFLKEGLNFSINLKENQIDLDTLFTNRDLTMEEFSLEDYLNKRKFKFEIVCNTKEERKKLQEFFGLKTRFYITYDEFREKIKEVE